MTEKSDDFRILLGVLSVKMHVYLAIINTRRAREELFIVAFKSPPDRFLNKHQWNLTRGVSALPLYGDKIKDPDGMQGAGLGILRMYNI